MSDPFFTIAFEGDIKEWESNPFHVDTPFGRPHTIGVGNVFDERDALLEALEPFEDIIGEHADDFPDDTKVTIQFGRTTYYALTLGDLRRVQTALAKAEGRT